MAVAPRSSQSLSSWPSGRQADLAPCSLLISTTMNATPDTPLKRSVLPCMLRVSLLVLALLAPFVAGAEHPFDFGLAGRVTIIKATYWMDGGSVSVYLRDKNDRRGCAHYQNTMWPAERHGGLFGFRASNAAKMTHFPKHGSNEAALLQLLRVASIETFGTAAPKKLEKAGGWDRMAMARLFRAASSPRTLMTSK